MFTLTGRRKRVEGLAWSADGRWLAAGGRGVLSVWDMSDPRRPPVGPPPQALGHDAPAFLAGGRVLSRAARREWEVFDPADGRLALFRLGDDEPGRPVVAPDGTRVVLGHTHLPLRLWQVSGDRPTLVWRAGNRTGVIQAAAFRPDGDRVATAEVEYTSPGRAMRVVVRSADTGVAEVELPGVYVATAGLLYTPDGRHLLAWSGKGFAVLDPADPGAKPRKAANPDTSHFAGAAFHPSGRWLLTASNDRVVRLWDTAAWTPARAFTWDIGKLYAVAVSPDGTRAAVGSHTGRVLVWDLDV